MWAKYCGYTLCILRIVATLHFQGFLDIVRSAACETILVCESSCSCLYFTGRTCRLKSCTKQILYTGLPTANFDIQIFLCSNLQTKIQKINQFTEQNTDIIFDQVYFFHCLQRKKNRKFSHLQTKLQNVHIYFLKIPQAFYRN